MRWAPVPHEKPPRDGQYHCWHPRMGRVVMGYVDGSWGAQPPAYWLANDGNPYQAPDGSFASV